MRPVFVYAMKRTPIGQMNGIYKYKLPEYLMADVLIGLTKDIDPTTVEESIIANAVGPMGNIGRLSWLSAHLPEEIPSTSIDFQCGGALKAIEYAYLKVASGVANAVIAGGTESTSLEPERFYHPNDPRKTTTPGALKRAQFAPTHLGDVDMLVGAENTASRYQLSREALDAYAYRSHSRALEAHAKGMFNAIKTESLKDESIRETLSPRLLARARPLLRPQGVTTAANACLMHDGAAGVLLGSEGYGRDNQLRPLAKLIGFTSIGCDPNFSPLGAVYAVEKLLLQFELTIDQIDLIEVNEAFSAKVLSFSHYFNYPLEQINVHGGALAYGHPYAASGAIYFMHLIENLAYYGKQLGIITLGVAGGQGIACLLEVNT